MKTNPLRVRQLVKGYKYKVICGSDEALAKEIVSPELNVPGVELAGFYDYTDFTNGVVFGEKECVFISRLNEIEQNDCFQNMTKTTVPFIILSEGIECPEKLKEYANASSIAILSDDKTTSVVVGEVYSFILNKLTPQILLHGTLIEVFGSGVLLKGTSGIGKSEIALELIKKGHRLIADDSVVAYRRNHHLYGKAPEHLRNLLEVRGLGLIDVYRLFGVTAVRETGEINYIIDLVSIDTINETNRLLDTMQYTEIDGLRCQTVRLPVTSGRSMADLVEVAVMDLRNRTLGHNATEEFIEKFDKMTKGEIDDD